MSLSIWRIISELKACCSSRNLDKGKTLHDAVVRSGLDSSVFVANTLMDMYGKCGCLERAHSVFDKLQGPDQVSWNTLISGYAANGQGEEALHLFARMRREACPPGMRTFVPVLQACTDLAVKEDSPERGIIVQLLASTYGCDTGVYVNNSFINFYAKCRSMDDAQNVFAKMQERDAVSWNTLIMGYAENGEPRVALDVFSKMDCPCNERTYVSALKACTELVAKEEGKALHLLASCDGSDSDVFVENILVDMYSICKSMQDARKIFDSMHSCGVVAWNAILMGYTENGDAATALGLFSRMDQQNSPPNERTFVAAIKACGDASLEDKLRRGESIHLLACTKGFDINTYVENTLMDMYARCASMDCARRVFERMRYRDVVSWNAIISGYADNGKDHQVVDFFIRMKREGLQPDRITYILVLKSCGILGTLEFGRSVHAEVLKHGFESDIVVANCLVDFYAKCGNLEQAMQVFHSQKGGDLIAWTALMSGFSRQGNTKGVFDLFDKMLDQGVQPDGITLLCVLAACSHSGLVEKGKDYFQAMSTKYGVSHNREHYSCMIDMLGRANKLDECIAFLRGMPFNPNDVMWRALLGACQKWKNTKLANLAFESLTTVEESNSGGYVLLSMAG